MYKPSLLKVGNDCLGVAVLALRLGFILGTSRDFYLRSDEYGNVVIFQQLIPHCGHSVATKLKA